MRTISTRASFTLSETLLGMLRRRVAELGGLAIIAAAGIVLLALATWSALDPNLNHATGGAARNFIGRPGAAVADFLMQLFGLASVALVLAGRRMGMAADHASRPSTRCACAWSLGSSASCSPPASSPASR